MKNKLLIFLLCLLVGVVLGIIYVPAGDYDFFSYKYYTGWAFLNHRIDIDFMPVMFRTYFHPLINAINFLLIEKLNFHPYLYLALSSLKIGCFMFLTYLIADTIFVFDKYKKIFVCVSVIILTIFSPIILYTFDFSHYELIFGTIILTALYLYLKNIYKSSNLSLILLFFSSFLVGASTGLWYTQGVFVLTFLLITLINYRLIDNPLKKIIIMSFGFLSGFIMFGAPWLYTVFQHFQNPFFPYFNEIFKSPMASIDSVLASDYADLTNRSFLQLLFMPFANTLSGYAGIEGRFNDPKIIFTFISVLIFYLYKKPIEKLNIVKPELFNIIIIFTIISYYINLFVFVNWRYVIGLFALMPIIIFTVLYYVLKNYKLNNYYACLSVLIACLCTRYIEHINLALEFVLLFILLSYVLMYIYIHFFKNRNFVDKSFYYRFIIIICFLLCTIRFYSIGYHTSPYKNLLTVQDMQIEDNSNVICGTILASYVLPSQNQNIKSYGFSIPQKLMKNVSHNRINHYYTNDYLYEKLKDIFNSNEHLYFIYDNSYYTDKVIFNEIVSDLSDGKIKRIKNCEPVKIHFMGYYREWTTICKLK